MSWNGNDLTVDTATMYLFVGPSGTGKKSAAASFPGPTYYFDFDGRKKGLIGCPWINRDHITGDDYPPDSDVVTNTEKKVSEMVKEYNSGILPYKNIILASITGQTTSYLQQGNRLTHVMEAGKVKGKVIGSTNMAGPAEYGFEATATYNLLSGLRRMSGVNIIVMAHEVPRYGKKDPNDPYSETIEIGSKLSIRDKIGANAMVYFTEVYQFRKEMKGKSVSHEVRFRSDLARTTHVQLPDGWIDVTGVNFYNKLQERIKQKDGQTTNSR